MRQPYRSYDRFRDIEFNMMTRGRIRHGRQHAGRYVNHTNRPRIHARTETEQNMREAYISVPLPGEHFSPNVRLILHNRGGVDDPVSFVAFLFGRHETVDPVESVLEVPFMRDILNQRTTKRLKGEDNKWRPTKTTVRTLMKLKHFRCVHFRARESALEDDIPQITHAWRLRYRTAKGKRTTDFMEKPTNEELKKFFKENNVLPFTVEDPETGEPHHELPRPRRESLRPWSLDPVAFNFLKRLAFRESRTEPLPASPHDHNLRRGDRFLAIVGPEVRNEKIAGIEPVAVVIVDVDAEIFAVMDLDFFVQISRGRQAILESEWWKAWYAENSSPISPPVEEPEAETTEETDEDEEEEEADDGPGLVAPIADHLASKATSH